MSSVSFGEIREIKLMSEAVAEVDEATLLIFDIDNTLLKPAQTLGADQWYDHLVKQYMATGYSESAAIDKAIAMWTAVQKATKVVAVEAVTPDLISKEQQRGIKAMALTARPLDLIDATNRQLKSIGVDFTRTPFLTKPLSLKANDLAKFTDGVLFVGPKNNKGKVLKQLFETTKKMPKHIVFVDDKVKHVRNVEDAMKDLPLKYIGFRYGATDEEVAGFKPAIADVQLRFFGNILDDASAAAIIK